MKGFAFITIIMPLFFVVFTIQAQERLETPVKLKIEEGNFEEVTVVVKNNTTGETNTLKGEPRLDLGLKLNCDYVISFKKPGYITKKIALNTTAPGDRSKMGFYPFSFEVILFKQYDGVNIVIFNQPVGKISFNRLIDDFDYDTDYTKQVQSALKIAEEEIKQKQKEAIVQAEQQKQEEAKKRAEAAAQAKIAAKEKLEADKKAAEEARVQAAQALKEKQIQEEQQRARAKAQLEEENQKKLAKIEEENRQRAQAKIEEENKQRAQAKIEEENRQRAQAKMEEEERAKARAAEAEEKRKKEAAALASEPSRKATPAGMGEDTRKPGKPGTSQETPASASISGNGQDLLNARPSIGTGDDQQSSQMAGGTRKEEKGISKATGTSGNDVRPGQTNTEPDQSYPGTAVNENFEVLPDISVEEIAEANRTITKVIVRKNQKETVFSKVKYDWGGVYYFRQNISISETLFFMNTGRR